MQFSQESQWQLGILFSLLIALIGVPALTSLFGLSLARSIEHDGVDRSYLLYSSKSGNKEEAKPLIIALHDDGSSARSLIRISQGKLNKLAENDDYLVVYPEGYKKQWNLGGLKGNGVNVVDGRGDAGFIRSLIETLEEDYNLDKDRIFLTGMGSGGVMALQLVCELPGTFKAIAVVTGSIAEPGASSCGARSESSLLLMNGTENPVIPYEGGLLTREYNSPVEILSTESTVDHWLNKNGCVAYAEETLLADADPKDDTSVTLYTYSDCRSGAQVVLYKIDGGGHTWPGGKQYKKEDEIGRTSKDIDGSQEIWSFFEQF